MPKDERVRVQIAFEGGQVVAALITPAAADAVQAALAGDEPVFELETEDGTYVLALRKIAYLKRTSREMHIGFGAIS